MGKARESPSARARRREQEREAQIRALEQARAASRAASAEARAKSSPPGRRRRVIQLGIVLVVVALVIGIVVITAGGGSKHHVTKAQTNEAVAVVDELLSGVPQHGNVLGDPKAPLTLQYFGDLECPSCREFTLGALPAIIEKWVRAGELRIVYRSLETATREPRLFETQQVAALSAGKQNKMWDYVELFYQEQGEEGTGYVTTGYLENLARQISGLNIQQWVTAINDRAFIRQLETDRHTAKRMGLAATPSFLLGLTGGATKELLIRSLTEPRGFNEAIEHLLITRKV
jgi:protein-disulfide isomerase